MLLTLDDSLKTIITKMEWTVLLQVWSFPKHSRVISAYPVAANATCLAWPMTNCVGRHVLGSLSWLQCSQPCELPTHSICFIAFRPHQYGCDVRAAAETAPGFVCDSETCQIEC